MPEETLQTIQHLSDERNISRERESLTSSHQTILPHPPQAIPAAFTCGSLFSLFSLTFSVTMLQSFLPPCNSYHLPLPLSFRFPLSPSRGYLAQILSTFSTQPLKQELGNKTAAGEPGRWVSTRDMCRGWGGGHISLLSSPTAMHSYLAVFFYFFYLIYLIKMEGQAGRCPSSSASVLTFLNPKSLPHFYLSLSHPCVLSLFFPSSHPLFPYPPEAWLTVPCHVILAASSGSTLLETGHDTPTAPPPRHPPPHTHQQTHTITPGPSVKMSSIYHWQH